MSETFWRISPDSKTYEADDLSGTGAEVFGGRWNEVGVPLVYASSSRSLACLETLVHLGVGALPLNRYLVAIDIPDDLLASAEQVEPTELVGWDAEPAGRASIAFGTGWAKSRLSLLLVVPSVIVPEERNLLINPAHPAAARVSARKVRKWLYDPRVLRGT
ncbi:RES family NAD+ phosphorylase [Novosphingobium sp. JCM 18896]|uniref:RES family NAD+ phosphorylase n=1 Tax=Novosphingobium sp. JCM 18896 TaxID=2989731 RepID=UPI0022220D22|nr:RES domain-containing protein [Novosphingobium sp. JCM 18896]MCW1431733.1 RES domain-containing protein [Novosphingobium sp. JCM 18896]